MTLKKKFKAAVLFKQKSKLKIVELDFPKFLDYGQVLVKIIYSGICGSQIGEIDGVKGKDKFLPHCLGHEGSGKVFAIGPGVKKVKKGDKVVLHWKPSNGIDAKPARYNMGKKIINSGKITTFSEYSVVSENRITKINKIKINLRDAALLGCTLTTAIGFLNYDIKLKKGESILIWGAGSIGLALTKFSKYLSARPISVVDLSHKKLEEAKKMGADRCFKFKSNRSFKEIYNKNKNSDVVIDTTGNVGIIEKSYDIISSIGRLGLVGVPHHKKKISINPLAINLGKKLVGCHGGIKKPHVDIPNYAKLIRDRKIRVGDLIEKVIKLRQLNEYIYKIKNNKTTKKILIKF